MKKAILIFFLFGSIIATAQKKVIISVASGTDSTLFTTTHRTNHVADSLGALIGSGGLTNPMTTAGDMIIATAGGSPIRLGVGVESYVLKVVGGVPTWAAASGSGWGLTGNAGTTAGTNFVGTTDAVDLVFKRNSTEIFRAASSSILPGTHNAINLGSSSMAFGTIYSSSHFAVLDLSLGTLSANRHINFYAGGTTTGAAIGKAFQAGGWVFGTGTLTNAGFMVDVRGTFRSQGLASYETNLASSYTARSHTDKNYVDSSIKKRTLTKSWSIPPTTATDNYTLFYTPVAITITSLTDVFQGSSPSYTYDLHHATTRSVAGTELFGTDRTTTSTTGSTTTTFTNAVIAAGSFIWIKASATSGTVTEFFLSITYTEN